MAPKIKKYKKTLKKKSKKPQIQHTRKRGGSKFASLPTDMINNVSKYLNHQDISYLRSSSNGLSTILTENLNSDEILTYISDQLKWLNTTNLVKSQQKYIKNATARISLYISLDEDLNQERNNWLIYITSENFYLYDLFEGVYRIDEFMDVAHNGVNILGPLFDSLEVNGVKSSGDPLANIYKIADLLKIELRKHKVYLDYVEYSLSNIDYINVFTT